MTIRVTEAQREFFLSEEDAQAVALVQAVEEVDRAGDLLPLAARREATEAARAAATDTAAWLAARGRQLSAALQRSLPFLQRFRRWTSPARGLTSPVVILAGGLGLASNALGPEQRINVLAVPLLGIVAWNLVVLALLAARSWLPFGAAALGSGAPRFVTLLESQARRLIDRLPRRAAAEDDLVRRCLERYLAIWLPAVAPLAAARGRRLLHAASLALIAGVVGGMYLRGIAFQYHATWQSTFLSSAAVDRFLAAVLAPAAALSGIERPTAVGIESPAYGDAGPWIHLYAVTAALFVGLPRLCLAIYESLRCARHSRRLGLVLPDGYVRRLLSSVDTSQRRLEVAPYSYRPAAGAADRLKRLLYDLLGPRSEIRLRSPLEYGAEAAELEPGGSRLRLLLFSLAQTPEVEVHGELLRQLRQDLPDGQALLAVVDGSAYRQRLAGSGRATSRLAERRRAWDRVVRDAGLEAVHVDLGDALPDDVLSRAAAAAWPPGTLAGAA